MAKKKATKKRNAVTKRKAVKKTVRKATKAKRTGGKRTSGLNMTTYSLSPELQAIVGNKKLTRPQIVKGLWEYIKAKKLQDPKNKRMICPDEKLSKVIGKKPVDMMKLAGLLSKHLKK